MSPTFKIFLRFAVGFAVTLTLGNLLTDFFQLRFVFSGTREHLFVFHHFEREEEPVDVVFFGTSATANGFVAKIAESSLEAALGRPARAWNLALPGGNPLPTPALIETYFDDERVPKILVVEGTPGFWNENRKGKHSFAYWRWWAPIDDVLSTYGKVDWEYTETGINRLAQGVETVWKVPGFLLSRSTQENFRHLKSTRGGEYSVAMVKAAEAGNQPVANDPVGRSPHGINPLRWGQLFTETIERTAKLCNEKGIALVLVNIPSRSDVMQHYNREEYDAFVVWMTAQSERLGFSYYELNQPSWIGQRSDFRGFIHLGPIGARDFTRRFSREVLAPILRGEQPPASGALTAPVAVAAKAPQLDPT